MIRSGALGAEHLLELGAYQPPGPTQAPSGDLASTSEVIHGRDRQMQQVGDLARRHHIIASEPKPDRGRGADELNVGGRDGHP